MKFQSPKPRVQSRRNWASTRCANARHQGIGRYYSAGNGLQRRYVTGQSTIAEGAGAKGLTEDYPTLRCGAHA